MVFFMIFLTVLSFPAWSQSLPKSAYGLPVVNTVSLFEETLYRRLEKEMIPVYPREALVLDLRYATGNNFTHEVLYKDQPRAAWLRKPVALALDSVLADLRKLNLGLKIFDAYRPYSITVRLWKKEPDARYAADPAKGSGHNRGIAIDLTLVDLATRKQLEMPTGFDSFSDSAHQDFMSLSPEVLQNRSLLKTIMEKRGFIALSTEWWHFSWPHPENYEVLDLGFNELRKYYEGKKKLKRGQ
jgi:D-alanyl-D-alanine dipeptidase